MHECRNHAYRQGLAWELDLNDLESTDDASVALE